MRILAPDREAYTMEKISARSLLSDSSDRDDNVSVVTDGGSGLRSTDHQIRGHAASNPNSIKFVQCFASMSAVSKLYVSHEGSFSLNALV